jgi:hypothetical protein
VKHKSDLPEIGVYLPLHVTLPLPTALCPYQAAFVSPRPCLWPSVLACVL